jgi:hypothetical protein
MKTSPVIISAYNIVKRIESMKVNLVRNTINKSLENLRDKLQEAGKEKRSSVKEMTSPNVKPSKTPVKM